MPRLDRQHFRRALLLGAAILATTLSCGREVTGPPGGMQIVRGFTFDARFGPEGMPSGVASDLVPFTRVRVVLVNSSGATVVDRVVDFPSSVPEVTLSLDVPLTTGSATTGEVMSLSLAYVNAAGDTVFRGGPQQVTVIQASPGSPPPPAPQIAVTFTGTGSAATQVVISPLSDTVVAGDAFAYTAVALDGQGSPIAGTPIAWRSESPTRATITAPGSGAGTTLASRGTAVIIAQLLSGPADTVSLEVLPRAQALAVVSGGGQSALVGATVPAPVVVRVNATDGLPIAGVTVNFAAANGGSVGTASAVSDVNGLVQTTWTLGAGVGVQSLTATSTGLAGSPLAISATATAPVVQLIHHYPFTTDVSDIVGTANGTAVGSGLALTGGVLALNGTDGYVQFASRIVPSTGSYSVSLFVRNRSTTSLTTYLSQGTSGAPGFYIGHDVAGNLRVSDDFPSTGGPAPAADGLFHHVVLVVDSIANQGRVYVDGTQLLTLVQRIATPPTGNNTRLGRQFDPFGEFMDGDIDELRIYSGAIDGAQVAALHAAGVSAPGRLVFGTQPSNVVAGAAISPAVVVRVEDALGRIRTAFNGPVTIALDLNPGGATLGGTLTVNAVGGIATFADLSLGAVASGYRFRATADGGTAVSSGLFDVLSGAATSLEFTQQPTNALPATVIAPALTVTARDALGNVATGFTGAVTLAFGANPATAVLGGTLTVNAVAGVATFTNVTVDRVGAGFTLTATATGLPVTTSGAFSILAGAATQLDVTQQPTTAVAGVPFTPALVVTARDAGGNVSTGFTGEVTVVVWNGNGAIGGTVAVNAVAGVATFSNVYATATNTELRLRATAVGLSPDTTLSFAVAPSTPTALAFDTQPTGEVAGQPISPAVTVYAVDAFGNTTPAFSGVVTVAIANNPGAATLGGTLTVNPLGGVASFSDLTVSAAGSGYTLAASAPGVTGATSAAFDISAAVFANAWTNAAGGLWSTATNWSLGRAPIATDTVVIALDGTYTVTMDANFTGNIVLVGGGIGVQTLAVGVRTLAPTDGLAVLGTGAITLNGAGNLAGSTISNQGTITTVGGTVSADLTNLGTFIAQGSTNVAGSVNNLPGAMFRALGSNAGSAAALTFQFGLQNDGAVEMTTTGAGYSVAITVASGSLVNGSTGTITSLAGAGGTRTLAAQLDNQGAVLLPYDLTLARASAVHLNSGTITTTGTADFALVQSGTTPSFTNTGTITLAAGRTMAVSAGLLDLSSGLVQGSTAFLTTTGSPTVRFTTATVQPRIGFAAGTVLPDPFVIPATDSLRIYSGTFAPPSLTNNGRLFLEGNTVLTTALTTGAGSLLRVRGTNTTSAANVTITNGFTNTDTLQFTTEGAGYSVQLNVPNGTLVNASTGTIASLGGAGGTRTLAAQLDNQGTVSLPYDLTLARASAAHVNSGTITTTGTADFALVQSGTTPSFTNTGTITLAAGRTMAVSAGLLDLSSGLVQGSTAFLTTTGSPTVRFTTATVQPRIGFAAGTVLPDPFVIPATDSLRIYSGTFAPPSLTNNGRLFLEGNTVLTTVLTTGPGSLLRVRGTNTTSAANVTITNGFTNTDTLQFTTEGAGYSVQLNVPNGTLVNASTGTIASLGGAGGTRTLAAQLDNQGTVSLPYDLSLARASAAHVNSGTITTTGTADFALVQSGTTPSFTNTGTITLAAGRTMSVSGGTLDLSAGLVAGSTAFLTTTLAPTVRFTTATVQPRIGFAAGTVLPDPFVIPASDSLRIYSGTFAPPSLTNNGRLFLEGSTVLTTALTTGPGSLLRVRGTNTTSAANVTITNGFTNTDTLQLTTEGAGYSVQLNVTNGTLVNASTGTIASLGGAGGTRVLAAQLDNQGAVLLPYDLTLARASANHLNSGTITTTGTADFALQQSGTTPSFTNTGTITLAAGRTMSVSGGTLDLSAGLVAGSTAFLTTTLAPTVRFTTATVQPRIGFSAGTVLPDPVVIPANDSLRIYTGTFAPPSLTNNGRLFLEGNTVLTTVLTTGPGSVLRVRGTNTTSAANVTITNGFTNTDTLQFTTEGAGYSVQLNVPNGTLVNASTGTIASLGGAGGTRTLAAQLDNQGAVLLPYELTLARASAAHVNSGTITATGTADFALVQSGTTPSFTNTGTITLAAGRTMSVSAGLLDLSSGLVQGATAFLTTTGSPTVRFTTATVQPRIGFAAGTVLPDPFVIPASDSLRIYAGTFAPPSLTNNGRLFLEGNTVLTTALTTGAGSLLRVRGTNTTSAANVTITNGFTNTDTLQLTTEGAGYSVQLNVPNGTLLNASTGTIASLGGAGGTRTLAAQLDNQGTVSLPYDLTLARASAAHLNSGTITATGTADFALVQSGTTPSFTNTGTITLAAGRTMSVSAGLLDLSAGLLAGYTSYLTTTGAPTVRFSPSTVQPRIGFAAGTVLPDPIVVAANDSLRLYTGTFAPPTLTNNGFLALEGNAVLTTALTSNPGSAIVVRGTNTTSAASVTITNGFTNAGIFRLVTEGAGYSVAASLGAGTLTNAATGTLEFLSGAGGTRALTAGLVDNFGAFNAAYSGTVNGPLDQRGSLSVAAAQTLTVTGLTRLLDGSTTTVLGTLTKSGGCTQSGVVTLSGTTCP